VSLDFSQLSVTQVSQMRKPGHGGMKPLGQASGLQAGLCEVVSPAHTRLHTELSLDGGALC
jgi:hypothetical protein